jgi:hypothetical protein
MYTHMKVYQGALTYVTMQMSQWGEDWHELSSLLLMGDRIASPRPISSSSALPRSSAAAVEYLLG